MLNFDFPLTTTLLPPEMLFKYTLPATSSASHQILLTFQVLVQILHATSAFLNISIIKLENSLLGGVSSSSPGLYTLNASSMLSQVVTTKNASDTVIHSLGTKITPIWEPMCH